MWVSKKKWNELNKKVADLETTIQDQQGFLVKHIKNHEKENKDFRKAISEVKESLNTDLTKLLSE